MGIAYLDQLNNFMQGDVCEYCGKPECEYSSDCRCWDYDGDESEDEVHPMYCQWCGAEYGEDWAQCTCWDDTGLEVES